MARGKEKAGEEAPFLDPGGTCSENLRMPEGEGMADEGPNPSTLTATKPKAGK